jgi:hypothetical protein
MDIMVKPFLTLLDRAKLVGVTLTFVLVLRATSAVGTKKAYGSKGE